MSKKLLAILSIFTVVVLSFSVCFATDNGMLGNAANGVRNIIGGAENAIEDGARGLSNASKDATGGMENSAQNIMGSTNSTNMDNTNSDSGNDANTNGGSTNTTNNDNRNMSTNGTMGTAGLTTNGNNSDNGNTYTATRTATDTTGATFLGMNSTAWTWLIIGIAAIAIVALVWYYGTQLNSSRDSMD